MKVSFLIHNAYGIGGTITTTFNLAGALAERHDVEIVSVLRHREHPNLTPHPDVGLRALVDLRREKDHPLHRRPAGVFPSAEYRHHQYSELTDLRIAEYLEGTDADVVVGTRPGLNVHLALQAPQRVARVGQEHLTLDNHPPALRTALRRAYRRLDVLTTVTEADARAYRRKMRLPGVRVEALPNSVPDPVLPAADGSAKVVIAAGRLVPVKRYDLIIEAFAQVVAECPDWQLRIYGKGEEEDRLRARIEALGLWNNVFLMGAATPMEAEWVKGSIGAAASNFEPFGMTIVEAMRCGLPVVSTDCPYGPGEIIRDGEDGRLVPVGDSRAFGAALLDLVRDDELRRRMGEAAVDHARRFAPGPVVAQAERLLEEAVAARSGGRRGTPGRGGMRHALLGQGHAARDLAHAAASGALRTVRGRRR
ncbi:MULTISPECIES: glycosyltransferase family 4 protein [Streptomyces]|uniref:D-inositol 3-phosphate glycosyltransferase n=2 Tax=Streptomyces viridosporus TaxID=67581 RepID=A0ABX6AAY1_STRVD|nr:MULTISPECIES: glycosyltransferase family 4 protein [Streptomyces]EFE71323.1 transferase [Streptomyces viridosporus ATCC 14672]PWJ08234.1 glycosyltransferase family 4 protein [Streptomyces sp. NWU49]QEU84099.1 glycosyltransferase family 4 protein [Streptomyces viridosporus T7A]